MQGADVSYFVAFGISFVAFVALSRLRPRAT